MCRQPDDDAHTPPQSIRMGKGMYNSGSIRRRRRSVASHNECVCVCVCVIIAASATTTAVVPLSSLVGLWYRRTIGSTTSSAVLGAVVCDGDAGVDVDSRNGHGTYAASEKLTDVCPPRMHGRAMTRNNDSHSITPRSSSNQHPYRSNERESKKLWSSHHPHFSLSFTTIVSAALNYSNERTNDRLSDPINPLQKY